MIANIIKPPTVNNTTTNDKLFKNPVLPSD